MGDKILRTSEDVDAFIEQLCKMKLPLTVTWVQGANRSHAANNLQWMWASEVAYQLGDRGPEDVQAEWKLRHGIPILRADDPTFREHYDATIRQWTYERKIEAMKLGYPVSSQFKVRQMVRYLDAIEAECRSNGLELTQPDPDLAAYHKKYRETASATRTC